MDNVELKQYEQGNFSSIYIGAKPIIKFAMLRLENFISYYLSGPGGLDYKSEVHDVESYAREIFYIERADANKIENWIVYYDDEHNCMAIRHCFWNKALDREQIMNEESLRVAVREQCIVDSIPHIQNETVIGVNEIDKNNILNTINAFDTAISEMNILKLFSNVDYSTGDYRISRSYDLDVRIEAIINEAQNELYSAIGEIQSLIVNTLKASINTTTDYKVALDYQFSPIDIALGTIQAYRYNCINLNILESLFYRMDMLELIDEMSLSSELKEITFQGMALEDVESWVGGVIPTTLLVDTINSIDFECKALLLSPVYRACFNSFNLFEVVNKEAESLTIDFDSLLSFEYVNTVFLLGYTLFLAELDDYFNDVFLVLKENILQNIKVLDFEYSDEFNEVIQQFDRIDIDNDVLNIKRQKIHLNIIEINIRDYFYCVPKNKVDVNFTFSKVNELTYHVISNEDTRIN